MNEVNLVLLIMTLFIVFYIFIKSTKEHFFAVPTGDERPFVNVYDENRNQLPIVLLSHPFTRDSSYEQYKQYKKDNFLVLGISSYNEFPSITTNKHDVLNNPSEKAWKNYDYMKVVDGWLHCFRNPEKHIKSGIPKVLISESDFCNYDTYKPNSSIEKKYDFLYICPKDGGNCDGWVATNKNWELGKQCIDIMCNKFKLRGLLVGRKGCPLPKGCDELCETTGFLSQAKLIEAYNQCKFILVPNQSDASPRVLTEALCCNLPALLNYNIVGGWKYIGPQSGAFFKSANDLEPGLRYILDNLSKMSPREYYLKNFSKPVAGKRLKHFIEKHFKDKIDVSNYKYLTL
jgi:hypothetical protein